MKGIEFLRRIYATSGLSITQKTTPNGMQILKEIMRSLGLDPEEILTKEVLAKSQTTVIKTSTKTDWDEDHLTTLLKALKQKLKQELMTDTTTIALKTV